MEIKYLNEFGDVIADIKYSTVVPREGEMVIFDEEYYVKSVVWYPKLQIVGVFLVDEISKNIIVDKEQSPIFKDSNRINKELKDLSEKVKNHANTLDNIKSNLKHNSQKERKPNNEI